MNYLQGKAGAKMMHPTSSPAHLGPQSATGQMKHDQLTWLGTLLLVMENRVCCICLGSMRTPLAAECHWKQTSAEAPKDQE